MRPHPSHPKTQTPETPEGSKVSGRRAKSRSTARYVSTGLAMTLVLSAVALNPIGENFTPTAGAVGTSNKVSVYLSAPMVMGSGVTEAVQRATFDDLPIIPVPSAPADYSFCPNELDGIGPITFRESPTVTSQNSRLLSANVYDGICAVDAPGVYGGASTDTSVRTFGGTGTRYMKVPFYDKATKPERSITFQLASAAKYVGFWWSGGNAGNLVRFFDANNNLVAEIDSADIEQLLGGANTSNPTGDVISEGGTAYSKSSYRGNPVYYSNLDTKPTTGGGTNGNPFIYTYLNLFVEGSLGITQVQFAGPGFEFDNLALSTVQQSPEASMVEVLEKNSADLTWDPNTSLLLSASPETPSQMASTVGGGAITYAVKSQGGTGCTVHPTTGVITYTAVGNCVVTATSAASSTSFKSSKDVTFVIATSFAGNSSGGNSGGEASSGTAVSSTPALPVDPCTLKSTEVKSTYSKSFPGFAINSSRLTPAMKRQIRNWLNKHPEEVCVSVRGFTMGPRVLPIDPKLARDRARSVRAFIKSIRPEASFTPITSRTQRLVGDDVRRAKVTLRF